MFSRRVLIAGGLCAGAAGLMFPVLRPRAESGTSAEEWAENLVTAARSQIGVTLVYDPSYSKIAFPGGDVPRFKGVCTDVIVRAYRDGLNLDLQALVHADMRSAFGAYPKNWGLKTTDSNIDHRRVPNLQTFLKRQNAEQPIGTDGLSYLAGDVITQMLPGNKPHIAIVSDMLNDDGSRPLLIHNIGWGTRMEDILFTFSITGHYRYSGQTA
ncbi:DUF1287 domain-containing protein [Rhizobium herbae]|nr:DUF1287 domain-containing protein [Rhizobium herbae]